jgi:hypothetical protein
VQEASRPAAAHAPLQENAAKIASASQALAALRGRFLVRMMIATFLIDGFRIGQKQNSTGIASPLSNHNRNRMAGGSVPRTFPQAAAK